MKAVPEENGKTSIAHRPDCGRCNGTGPSPRGAAGQLRKVLRCGKGAAPGSRPRDRDRQTFPGMRIAAPARLPGHLGPSTERAPCNPDRRRGPPCPLACKRDNRLLDLHQSQLRCWPSPETSLCQPGHAQARCPNSKTGAHINTVEAVNAVVHRALIGVYHRPGRRHLQRYLDEIIWRWNHRVPAAKVRKRKSASGLPSTETRILWKPIPVVNQMRGLLRGAVGRQLRCTHSWGLR